jgi:hypothetical protein
MKILWMDKIIIVNLIGSIIISTPNGISGVGEFYYKMYQGCLTGINNYIPIIAHWSKIPEYDETWYYNQCALLNFNYRLISAELELSFVSSGATYLPNLLLDTIGTVDPIHKVNNNELWIFETPEKNKKYIMGVDVAYGSGNDSSTFQIIDVYTLKQVAEYNSNTITVDKFADIIVQYAQIYNNCLINVEINAVRKSINRKDD